MSQLFSYVGLLLVPLGLFWLWFEITKRKTATESDKKTRRFAIATILMLGFIIMIVSVGALTNYNLSFGILFLVICFYLLTRTYLKFKRQGFSNNSGYNPFPIYIITIPIVVALVRFTFITTGVEFSRNYAIKKSEPLITAIEAHYETNGRYPISLQALHPDILPGIMGIDQYHYEPNGTAYNLYFKQFSDELDVEEIVMYNKFDEQAFAAHVLDILVYSGEALALRRGDRHRYKLSTPHWVYIKYE
jgi:hypothetical protein